MHLSTYLSRTIFRVFLPRLPQPFELHDIVTGPVMAFAIQLAYLLFTGNERATVDTVGCIIDVPGFP